MQHECNIKTDHEINTVIFDIGGVLVELGRFRFLENKGFTGELAQRVMYATMRSEDWVQMDLNNLSEEEILQRFIENDPQIEREIRHMFENVNGIVEPKQTSLPWLQRIKASGRRILFLSNYSHKIMRECADALYFLPEMDGGLFSCDVHMVKPDPAFYQLLIDRYDLDPARCVFIDDLAANLEPAEALGIRTILFQSQDQAEQDLDRLLGGREYSEGPVLESLKNAFSVCKVTDYAGIEIDRPFVFIGRTDEEKSLVCPTDQVPADTLAREDGWRAFRICGELDFSLIGILSKISTILAENEIGIFAVSTYNTDYILTKSENYERALKALADAGYRIIAGAE